jgi:hypothetical protein
MARRKSTLAKRYQRCNQNPYIEEEQTTQWPKDTKCVIRIRISKKNRQHIHLWYLLANVLFLLAIVLSVLLRYTDSDYTFGIFKVFLIIFIVLTDYNLWYSSSNYFLFRYSFKNIYITGIIDRQ